MGLQGEMKMKVKDLGQVFTPVDIVNDVLDAAGYNGEDILNKHVIDNSCGDGAFLLQIIDRYVKAYKEKYQTLEGVEKDLKKYIHGIEIDKKVFDDCNDSLTRYLIDHNFKEVSFDIINGDALKVTKFYKKMDFVLGNPPYVRVHNLNKKYKEIREYSFCESGMTDLYLVFYEIGLNMLNKNGILCYITPNSFYNSIAGNKLRQYIKENQTVELIMDVGHYQPFDVNTYTAICKIKNNYKFDVCKYFKYNIETGRPKFISNIKYEDLFVDNNIVLSSDNKKFLPILTYKLEDKLQVLVKNGFATLNDNVFIQSDFSFKGNQIEVIKGSTGEWKKCIYPYDKNGKSIPFEMLDKDVQKYLRKHKKELTKKSKEANSSWYAFGRTQAIHDVPFDKISINTTIKDIASIKLNKVAAGKGIYSGLYLLTDISFQKIKNIICNQEFIEYLKLLNKCKSGGYYTFSSKDLAKYINYYLEVENEK